MRGGFISGDLFRKEAVENYKKQFSIDKQITKLSFSSISLILLFGLGLLFTSVWFIFGNIVNTVNVTGIVYPTDGIEKITASKSGMISEVTVNIGEDVKMEDTVAIIPDAAVIISMTAVMLFSTVMPQAQYYIFNNLIPAGIKSDIIPIGCLLFGVIVISLMIYIFRGIITANIPLCVSANLQGAVISRLLKLKAGFFTEQKSGSLSSSIIKISDISEIFS